jgi:excinuclease ABC subunit A
VHWLRLSTTSIHTVHALNVAIPRGRMTAVTGVSGSGKTTMVLESLVPALQAAAGGSALPAHVSGIEAGGIDRVRLVDSTPIGINVRSTLATYAGIMDMLRKAFAGTDAAKAAGLKVSAFSYNTGSLRCPQCDGTGQISLDVQFLPDVTIACPVCGGSRYQAQANGIRIATPTRPEGMSLPKVLDLEVDEALEAFANSEKPRDIHAMHARSEPSMISNAMRSRMHRALQTLSDLGLGYLKLGEDTPSLSGGEAQRLKLSNELGKRQETTLFVLDEPTTGLHPLDVRTLIRVLQRLIEGGATVIFIEHDLDMIANADYVIDMGPGGGQEGGRVVAVGTPDEIARDRHSVTGRYLAEHMN